LERKLMILQEEARKRLPEARRKRTIQVNVEQDPDIFGPMYAAFEDVFRGTREDIKSRVRVYLEHIRNAGAGGPEAPVLDIACGRGEWLELLRDNALHATGVDLNSVMVERCLALNLHVTQQDAMEYLMATAAGSLGAVTGFHLIEHLPLWNAVRILDEALRVLQPGGLLILETPNPANVPGGQLQLLYGSDPS